MLRLLPLAFAAWTGLAPGDDGMPEVSPFEEPAQAASCVPPEPGFLTLDTAPWTVVYVDGVYAGSTPLFRQKMQPGPHTLTLVNEAHDVLSHEDVVIEEGRARKLKLVLELDESLSALDDTSDAAVAADDCFIPPEEAASLSVDTQPWSRIWVDGKLVGSTPLFKHPLVAGEHVVRLVHEDGRASFTRFTAAVGETVKLSLHTPDPGVGR